MWNLKRFTPCRCEKKFYSPFYFTSFISLGPSAFLDVQSSSCVFFMVPLILNGTDSQ